jgi:hypothetical protein
MGPQKLSLQRKTTIFTKLIVEKKKQYYKLPDKAKIKQQKKSQRPRTSPLRQ